MFYTKHPMNRKNIIWLYSYMVFGIIDLSLVAHQHLEYRHFTKPLILLSLIIYFVKGSLLIKNTFLRKSVIAALVFSLLGDMLSLYPQLFLYGLGSYFIASACYIFSFKLTQKLDIHLPNWYFVKLFIYNLPIYVIGAVFYFLIHQQLYHLKIPIVIYLCGLIMLVTSARERFKKTNDASFWQVLVGSALFVFSQGIYLADAFYRPLIDREVLMMGSYLLAQLLIVMGLRSHFIFVINQEIEKRKPF